MVRLDPKLLGSNLLGPNLLGPNLLGWTCAELERFVEAQGAPAFHGRQVFRSLFVRGVDLFEAMTDIPLPLRDALARACDVVRPSVTLRQIASDGTRKYQLQASDGASFEAVYIPEVAQGRKTHTVCISSQSGCAVGCAFCFTASLRRHRNLTASEMVGQVLAVQDDVKSDPWQDSKGAPFPTRPITNVVFMGMGEPLLNYAHVVQAARVLLDPSGLHFSSRRVTISTAGIVPRLSHLGRDLPVQLAISLNATTDRIRTQIMPINKKWPLAELLAAMRAYPLRPRRRITVEYVLLGGVNDSIEDARRLPRLLAGIPVKINLLPLNPHDRTVFVPPSAVSVRRFQDILRDAGFNARIRTPRGQDIAAACGQLGKAGGITLEGTGRLG